MKEILQALIDGLVQGVTEFLPISSSAHLYLAQLWQEAAEDPLGRIVVVHLATLCGGALATRRQWLAGLRQAARRDWRGSADAGKLHLVALSCLPALLAGALLSSSIPQWYRLEVIGATTLGFGILLALAWRWGRQDRGWADINVKDAIIAGLAQVFAFIPGTSRAGICLTALRARGLHPAEAARFSVLMALPVLGATVAWLGWRWWRRPELLDPASDILAGLVALACSWGMVRYGLPYLEKAPQGLVLWVCIGWRLVLGIVLLLAYAYGWGA